MKIEAHFADIEANISNFYEQSTNFCTCNLTTLHALEPLSLEIVGSTLGILNRGCLKSLSPALSPKSVFFSVFHPTMP